MLAEKHAQFSILNSEMLADTLQDYKALIVAEQIILNPKECDAIRRFVSDGGALLVTGGTGVRDTENKPLSNFALADVLGIRYISAVHGIRVRLRCSARPRRVALVPENKSIAFEWRDGWASFLAEPVTIDSAYMIET